MRFARNYAETGNQVKLQYSTQFLLKKEGNFDVVVDDNRDDDEVQNGNDHESNLDTTAIVKLILMKRINVFMFLYECNVGITWLLQQGLFQKTGACVRYNQKKARKSNEGA